MKDPAWDESGYSSLEIRKKGKSSMKEQKRAENQYSASQ
jgi:hypothetical protein